MPGEEPDSAIGVTDVERNEASVLMSVVTEGVIGAAGGLVGTAVTIGVLVVAASIDVFDLASFQFLATLVGGDVLLPGRTTTVGFLVFLAHGMFIWPLFFASIGRYIPGDRFALKGLLFGTLMWTGFVVVFYQGYAGLALAGYLVLTLLAHLGYGFTLGAVFDYFSSDEGRLLLRPEV